MTPKERAVMQQALDALEHLQTWPMAKEAITALREALAEQAEQEPVGWWDGEETAFFEHELNGLRAPAEFHIPLYAAPVRTKDLTEDEIIDELNKRKFDWVAVRSTTYIIDSAEIKEFARAVIAADREKQK